MGINKINLNKTIDALFEKNGLKLVENDKFKPGYYLPDKSELSAYESKNEAAKLKLIKNFVYKENHLEVINWELFLPNIKTNKDEERIIKYIFDSVRIQCINGYFKITFHNLINFLLKDILNNKDFIKLFSNEFQVKAIFSSDVQMYVELRKVILTLIEAKINELGIKDTVDVELPNLIMNYLDQGEWVWIIL